MLYLVSLLPLGAITQLGRGTILRFNHPAQAARLRQTRQVQTVTQAATDNSLCVHILFCCFCKPREKKKRCCPNCISFCKSKSASYTCFYNYSCDTCFLQQTSLRVELSFTPRSKSETPQQHHLCDPCRFFLIRMRTTPLLFQLLLLVFACLAWNSTSWFSLIGSQKSGGPAHQEKSLHTVELFSTSEKLSALPERRPGAAAFKTGCFPSCLQQLPLGFSCVFKEALCECTLFSWENHNQYFSPIILSVFKHYWEVWVA